jgi:hypothetical protein
MMRFPFHRFSGVFCVTLGVLITSCASYDPTQFATRPNRVLHDWYDDGGPGKVSIRISLPDQIAEFKRGGRDIGWCYVATGKEGYGTRAGSYRIMEKIVDKYSNKYGWIEDAAGNMVDNDATPRDRVPKGMRYVPAPMPYWMRLTSYGIGMHGGIIPEPGKPASHGCIRMPKEFAPVAFNAVEVGTPVTITSQPSKHGPQTVVPQRMLAAQESQPFAGKPVLKARRVSERQPVIPSFNPFW